MSYTEEQLIQAYNDLAASGMSHAEIQAVADAHGVGNIDRFQAAPEPAPAPAPAPAPEPAYEPPPAAAAPAAPTYNDDQLRQAYSDLAATGMSHADIQAVANQHGIGNIDRFQPAPAPAPAAQPTRQEAIKNTYNQVMSNQDLMPHERIAEVNRLAKEHGVSRDEIAKSINANQGRLNTLLDRQATADELSVGDMRKALMQQVGTYIDPRTGQDVSRQVADSLTGKLRGMGVTNLGDIERRTTAASQRQGDWMPTDDSGGGYYNMIDVPESHQYFNKATGQQIADPSLLDDRFGTTFSLGQGGVQRQDDIGRRLGMQLASQGHIDPTSGGGAWVKGGKKDGLGAEEMIRQLGQRLHERTGITNLSDLQGRKVQGTKQEWMPTDDSGGGYYQDTPTTNYEFTDARTGKKLDNFTGDLGGWAQGQGFTHGRLEADDQNKIMARTFGEDTTHGLVKAAAKLGPLVNVANFLTGGALTPVAMAVNAVNAGKAAYEGNLLPAAMMVAGIGAQTGVIPPDVANTIQTVGKVAGVAKNIEKGNLLGAATGAFGAAQGMGGFKMDDWGGGDYANYDLGGYEDMGWGGGDYANYDLGGYEDMGWEGGDWGSDIAGDYGNYADWDNYGGGGYDDMGWEGGDWGGDYVGDFGADDFGNLDPYSGGGYDDSNNWEGGDWGGDVTGDFGDVSADYGQYDQYGNLDPYSGGGYDDSNYAITDDPFSGGGYDDSNYSADDPFSGPGFDASNEAAMQEQTYGGHGDLGSNEEMEAAAKAAGVTHERDWAGAAGKLAGLAQRGGARPPQRPGGSQQRPAGGQPAGPGQRPGGLGGQGGGQRPGGQGGGRGGLGGLLSNPAAIGLAVTAASQLGNRGGNRNAGQQAQQRGVQQAQLPPPPQRPGGQAQLPQRPGGQGGGGQYHTLPATPPGEGQGGTGGGIGGQGSMLPPMGQALGNMGQIAQGNMAGPQAISPGADPYAGNTATNFGGIQGMNFFKAPGEASKGVGQGTGIGSVPMQNSFTPRTFDWGSAMNAASPQAAATAAAAPAPAAAPAHAEGGMIGMMEDLVMDRLTKHARGGLAGFSGGGMPDSRHPYGSVMFMSEGGERNYVTGPGDGQSDDVPAMLANGEYVIDSDVVAALGDGSNEAGAAVLDNWRQNIRAHKRSGGLADIPPKSLGPDAYMQMARGGRTYGYF